MLPAIHLLSSPYFLRESVQRRGRRGFRIRRGNQTKGHQCLATTTCSSTAPERTTTSHVSCVCAPRVASWCLCTSFRQDCAHTAGLTPASSESAWRKGGGLLHHPSREHHSLRIEDASGTLITNTLSEGSPDTLTQAQVGGKRQKLLSEPKSSTQSRCISACTHDYCHDVLICLVTRDTKTSDF